jgi:hypothetical protein
MSLCNRSFIYVYVLYVIKLIPVLNILHIIFAAGHYETNRQSAIYMIFSNYQEEFEDTKGVIWSRMSKKNKQYNGQKKKDKKTNNDLQNIHIQLKI